MIKKELDDKLKDCVRSFPVIYDASKKLYKDRIAKDNAWNALERDGEVIVSNFLLHVFNIE
jgi:hypothetical protein